jgi:hypothetical protein
MVLQSRKARETTNQERTSEPFRFICISSVVSPAVQESFNQISRELFANMAYLTLIAAFGAYMQVFCCATLAVCFDSMRIYSLGRDGP